MYHRYLVFIAFVCFFVCPFCFVADESPADIVPPPPPKYYKPYTDQKEVCILYYFPSGIKKYYNPRSLHPHYEVSIENTCGVSLYVPGPCDYHYVVYDQKKTKIVEGSGADTEFGPHSVRCKEIFTMQDVPVSGHITYTVTVDYRLYTYKKLDTQKETDSGGIRLLLNIDGDPEKYGYPQDRYELVNTEGEKYTTTGDITIYRNDKGEYTQGTEYFGSDIDELFPNVRVK